MNNKKTLENIPGNRAGRRRYKDTFWSYSNVRIIGKDSGYTFRESILVAASPDSSLLDLRNCRGGIKFQ